MFFPVFLAKQAEKRDETIKRGPPPILLELTCCVVCNML